MTEESVRDEANKAFEFTCQHYLGISGQTFLTLAAKGAWASDCLEVQMVTAMLPFAPEPTPPPAE